MNVWLAGRRVALKPNRSLGKGGEADVFDLGDGRALKVFKAPDHPDLAGNALEQEAARRRLEEHQTKLREFPQALPAEVVAPEALATDSSGKTIVGYAMRKVAGAEALFRLADPLFRKAGYPAQDVLALFAGIHRAVAELHRAGVVLGDFNDRNVLVRGTTAALIDADSFQFGRYRCSVFTDRFVDPLLCDGGAAGLRQVAPHGPDSDWYAFAVLLMQSLLFVGPYGGVFKPKDPAHRVPQPARPLRRITVFHPEVVYPKPAQRPDTLPDDLLQTFHRVFQRDERNAFPLGLLSGTRFTVCASCGTEHARRACPVCSPTAGMEKQVVARVRGKVVCKPLFETRGILLEVAVDGARVRYLHHEDGAFRREDGALVLHGRPDPRLRFALRGEDTLVARGGELVALGRAGASEKLAIDHAHAFGSDGRRRLWAHDGLLMRDGLGGIPELVGEVLAGQTRLWVGPQLGLGLYRAGALSVAFVFDPARGGLNDQLKLPRLPGELLDATCALDGERAWLRLAVQHQGRTRHLCLVYSRHGRLEAQAEADAGDASWLGTLGGACAVGGMLLVATDDGIVRVEARNGAAEKTREFPDTEPFVSSDCRLLAGPDGLVVATSRQISLLQMP